MRSLFVFLLILCGQCAHAMESLSFGQLAELSSYDPEEIRNALPAYIDREVEIRGFIYENDDGRFVLSTQPQLASCCQKKRENLHHQIYLTGGQLSSSHGKAVTVQGILSIAPVRDREGNLTELYALKVAKIAQSGNSVKWPLLGFGTVLLLVFWLKGRK